VLGRFFAVGLIWTVGAASVLHGADDVFVNDCRNLSSAPNRLTGTAAYAAAVETVAARLRTIVDVDAGDAVIVQPFATVQTRVRRCEMFLTDDRSLALQPMRPNGIMACVTPPDGVTGRLFHAGAGTAAEYGDRSPAGRIVVLDYNSGRDWLRAFRLGAAAVVFVRNGLSEAWQSHSVFANANLLRFYYDGPGTDLVENEQVTIHSEVVWEHVVGRNVYAFLRGTEPEFQMATEENIVLATNLDSYGEVPALTPGARGAAINGSGCARRAERQALSVGRHDHASAGELLQLLG